MQKPVLIERERQNNLKSASMRRERSVDRG